MTKLYNIPDTDIILEVSYDGKTIKVQDRYITQKSVSGKEYQRLQRGRELAQVGNGTGYLQVKVSYKSKTIRYYVHRLVWLVFNGEIPEGYEVDHINDDKSNCGVDNLQLLTKKQNMGKCLSNNPHILNNLVQNKAL